MTENENVQGISRRAAVTKIAVGTAAVWAAPAITSLSSASAATGSAESGLVFFDDFDEDRQGLSLTETKNFTVLAGNIDVIGPNFYDFYPGNGNYIDLDGTYVAGGSATFATKKSFPAGTYNLVVEMGQSPGESNNTVTIALGDASTSFKPSTAATSYSFPLVSTTGGPLSFTQPAGDNQGAILLTVKLYKV